MKAARRGAIALAIVAWFALVLGIAGLIGKGDVIVWRLILVFAIAIACIAGAVWLGRKSMRPPTDRG